MKKIICGGIVAALIVGIVSLYACRKHNNQSNNNTNNNSNEANTLMDLEHITPINTEETTTEEPTETETEEVTEPIIVKSLKFTSYGNGTCAVSGIGDITDSCVIIPERSPEGDIVISIDDLAFYGNKTIKTLQIPSTVTRIGARAFGNCLTLVYISVDTSNIAFCDIDGVLYSSDLSTLIHYPAASGASSIEIPSELKEIKDMAFYNCDNLKTIIYDGTYDGWGKIAVGELNYGLISAAISCTRGGK